MKKSALTVIIVTMVIIMAMVLALVGAGAIHGAMQDGGVMAMDGAVIGGKEYR